MASPDQEILNIFIAATANEIRRDTFMHRKFTMDQFSPIIVPRLEKVIGFASIYPRLFAQILKVVLFLWSPLFFPLLLMSQALSSFRFIRGKDMSKQSNRVFLATSLSSLSIANRSQSFDLILAMSPKIAKMTNGVHLWQFATLGDLAFAIRLAWMSNKKLKNSEWIPGLVLQNFAAFRWFLSWKALTRISNNVQDLGFVSDSDGWAVLFDRIPNIAAKTILQHGLLSDSEGKSLDRPNSPLPTRLKNITRIMLIDEKSKQHFRDIILEKESKPEFTLAVNINPPLQPWPTNIENQFKVIIIGQPQSIERECDLARQILNKSPQTYVIVKPHPSYSARPYARIKSSKFFIVKQHDLFPQADIALSFGYSSLLEAYELAGSTVFNCNSSEIDLIISTIAQKCTTQQF